jgi:hypothetical protein
MFEAFQFANEFACPRTQSEDEVASIVAASRLDASRQLIGGALRTQGKTELADTLSTLTAGAAMAWRPESGLMLLTLDRWGAEAAAFQCTLAFCGTGAATRCTVNLTVPVNFFLDGYVFTLMGTCSLTSDGQTVRVFSHGADLTFNRSGKRMACTMGSAYLKTAPVAVSRLGYVTQAVALTASEPVVDLDEATTPQAISSDIGEAMELIHQHAPRFLRWIEESLMGFTTRSDHLKQDDNEIYEYYVPGLIHMPKLTGPYACAEYLIRAASRQHVLMYIAMDPLFLGCRGGLSYCPFRRTYRFVDRLFAEAHADCNAILFYEALEDLGALDAVAKSHLSQLRAFFSTDHHQAINNAEGLTDAARCVWHAVRDEVLDRFVRHAALAA